MKKLDFRHWLLLSFSLMFMGLVIIGVVKNHAKTIVEKPTSELVNTPHIEIDTVKVVKMRHLTSSNLYNLHCKMCHGNYGKGDGVKARFDSTICPYDLTKVTKPDREIYYVVLNGERKMPNQHELDTTDVWVIVVYIKKFREIK